MKAVAVYRGPNFWPSFAWFALWASTFVGSIGLFLWLMSGSERAPKWMGPLLGACFLVPIFAFYAAYAVARSYFERRRGKTRFAQNFAPRVQAALDGKDAAVISIEARRVIEIESEDSGDTTWLFELAEGNTFYLRGDDYYPAEEDMPWPAKRFDIVRAAANDQLIGLFSKGAVLEPDRIVPSSEMPEEYLWAEEPKSESMLAGSAAENLRRLGHLAG